MGRVADVACDGEPTRNAPYTAAILPGATGPTVLLAEFTMPPLVMEGAGAEDCCAIATDMPAIDTVNARG